MSISAVDSSIASCTGYGMGQMAGSSGNRGPNPEEMAASIFEQDDADGDGFLSLSETPLDQDRFDEIDADGDGFLTQEELSQDAQSHMNNLTGQVGMMMQGMSPSEMAASIFEKDDADGDGLLTLEETPLDEDQFNAIDADGDGFITADELSAHMEENMAEGMSMPPAGAEEMAAEVSGSASGTAASGSSSSSSSSSSSGEYDAYDLNEDGVVTVDELLQAFQSGDASLRTMFESMDGGMMSTMQTRMAMDAYQAQMV